jgi:radical SAM-linked protein
MARPEGPPPPPVVQRLRVRYAKRGRLRFTSHRDVARVLERAIRRSGLPIAFSAGFSPHPRISYVGAAPTGVASEAEFFELGLAEERDPAVVHRELDAALPPGIDIVAVVPAVPGQPSLADRIQASRWQVRLPGVAPEVAGPAVRAFLAAASVTVPRRTKDGTRDVDARAAVVAVTVSADPAGTGCATLEMVVRHTTPAVRPDDVLAGVRLVAGLAPAAPAEATRIAQGLLGDTGEIADPLVPV